MASDQDRNGLLHSWIRPRIGDIRDGTATATLKVCVAFDPVPVRPAVSDHSTQHPRDLHVNRLFTVTDHLSSAMRLAPGSYPRFAVPD